MRFPVFAAIALAIAGVLLMAEACRDNPPKTERVAPQSPVAPPRASPEIPTAPQGDQETIERAIAALAPLIDPAKLDTLTGKRA